MSKVVPQIFKFPSVDSTNLILKQKALQGAFEGTVVVAKEQTLGRGRTDRSWYSPQGGLYFSILLKPTQSLSTTDLPLLAGLAMSQTVKTCLSPEDSVGVKWPNDCLLNGRKVGGVLCEVVGGANDSSVIVGVGINVNIPVEDLKPFEHRPFKATSMFAASSCVPLAVDLVLEKYLEIFFELYRDYLSRGFSFVKKLWEQECLFLGKSLELRETGLPEESTQPTQAIRGVFLGIDERGALVLSQDSGVSKSYVTGEITCYWP